MTARKEALPAPLRAASGAWMPLAWLAVGLAGAAAWFQPSVSASDLWWHLASGREIARTGWVPSKDPFSFTFAGKPWTNHEWLWDLIFWNAYSVSPDAAALLNLGMLLATFAVLALVLWKANLSPPACALTLVISAATMHWFLDIRPHVFSLLFTAIVLATRDRSWRLWLWPALMIVWANAHAGFVFGLGLFGLLALTRSLEWLASGRTGRSPLADWIAAAAAMAGAILNPSGVGIIRYPLSYLDRTTPFRALMEWLPPAPGLDPRAFNGRFFWMAILAAAGLAILLRKAARMLGPAADSPGGDAHTRARPRDPLFLAILAAVTFAMAWTSRRFIPLFALCSAPLVAVALEAAEALAKRLAVGPRIEERNPNRGPKGGRKDGAGRRPPGEVDAAPVRPSVARWTGLAAAALAALFLWKDVRLAPRLLYRWTQGYVTPEAAVRYLREAPAASRPFNSYNYGGYILLFAPDRRIFIDSRANTVYDEALLRDYTVIYQARSGFEALIGRYGIDSAIIDREAPLRRALLSLDPPWVEIYSDRLAAILLAPARTVEAARAGLPPDPKLVLAGSAEGFYSAAQTALGAGDLAAAARHAEEAVRANPLMVPGYGLLAFIRARQRDPEGIEKAIRAGIAAEPRWCGQMRQLEGQAYEELGDRPRAIAAYERGVLRGPFDSPAPQLARIKRLRTGS